MQRSNVTDKERSGGWRFAVDRGGTFTDVVAVDPDGGFHTLKLLSGSTAYGDPCIEGIRRIMGIPPGGMLPQDRIDSIRFGTTVATNALLERKGARVVLFITRGLGDLLEIGCQSRPDIFSLCIEKPSLLYAAVVEVDERIGPDGSVVREIDEDRLRADAERMAGSVDAAAVVFMHSWKNPRHELLCGDIIRRCGIRDVFLSHRSANLVKIVTRGQSTMVDAYLGPVMESYLRGIRKETGDIPVKFIESAGTLAPPRSFKGKGAVFSGPAGGVVAVAEVARCAGLKGAIGFDMGGTSTDVSRYDGEFEKIYEQRVGGVEIQGEALNITTVASGGGSILWFDGQRMRVGPESAGARPGPASYGLGGPLTVTDANLITGRIVPEFFPRTFGPSGDSALDSGVVQERFKELAARINASTGGGLGPEEAALGFIEIANEKMALAIKEISVARGYDVREYALVTFGGAGGQHACAIAGALGMKRIIHHPLGGLMSAYGIGLARQAERASRTVLVEYTRSSHAELAAVFEEMEKETVPRGWNGGFSVRREIDLRPRGAESALTVEFSGYEETLGRFRKRHERLFGFVPGDGPVEAVNLRIEVSRTEDFFPPYRGMAGRTGKRTGGPVFYRDIFYRGGAVSAPVYRWEDLRCGQRLEGPAVIVDAHSTLVVDPGFAAVEDERGFIVVEEATGEGSAGTAVGTKETPVEPDPVLLEVFNNIFSGVAAQMGFTLRNTAHSVNMKERLDFSCAVFDAAGGLVAGAQHIPVHIGAMAESVKAVMEDRRGEMRPGDVFLTNNPYCGGSHLPDMTVVEPVFSADGELIFVVASRGHHADIGGVTPGSLPPEAAHIDEEGVLVDGLLVRRDGVFREKELRRALTSHRYPARNIEERISDIMAQMASCSRGVKELKAVIERYGWDTVRAYMGHVQENAAYAVRRALQRFLGNRRSLDLCFEDALDDGTPLKVRVTVEAGPRPPHTVRATFDFTGTGPMHTHDNLNAPTSVTRSAVLYVLRAVTREDIPLNGGCLEPVRIIIPEGTLLNPLYPAPVGSGNVETSQRVVDVVLGALGVAAASQGTMNNLLFEVEGEPPYYETIGGGAGAVEGCRGASGVQVHMTNTRITDPEVLEFRHPGVRLERFAVRRGSGGEGRYPGGDGLVREVRFLRPAKVSIISERRVRAPYGLVGGGCGRKGKNLLKKADGTTRKLGHRVFLEVESGDSIVIETPGGGGYGRKACD